MSVRYKQYTGAAILKSFRKARMNTEEQKWAVTNKIRLNKKYQIESSIG